jgi:tetratricopeptide (TPR) repeat protein
MQIGVDSSSVGVDGACLYPSFAHPNHNVLDFPFRQHWGLAASAELVRTWRFLAQGVDPLNREARRWLGLMHSRKRDYDRSLEQAQLILAIDPNYPTAHVLIGVTRCAQRKFDEAIPELHKCVELSNRAPLWLGWLGLGVALSGDVPEACALLAQLRAAAERTYTPASSFAWIHPGLGELDETFAWMNRAIEERDPMMTPIRSYPFFDPIRSDPRFVELLRKMKLDF